ncbi:hypothetical protein SCAR479_01941 [Seiridium cardinale]|uniref:Uncharacterized protein n=1 Tax=Seiridium cardinale TaxID=138064 RepID=A0ABR2Y3U7_9PEZI
MVQPVEKQKWVRQASVWQTKLFSPDGSDLHASKELGSARPGRGSTHGHVKDSWIELLRALAADPIGTHGSPMADRTPLHSRGGGGSATFTLKTHKGA